MEYVYQQIKKNFILLALPFCFLQSKAQDLMPSKLHYYAVYFTDKPEANTQITEAHKYMSVRSIERKYRRNISITAEDMPVHTPYLYALATTYKHPPLFSSRWLNCAVLSTPSVLSSDDSLAIVSAHFVVSIQKIGQTPPSKPIERQEAKMMIPDKSKEDSYYGKGMDQIYMLGGQKLHEMGFRGEHTLIAVLDAGFANVDQITAFEELRKSNRILGAVDLVDFDGSVWEDDNHGTNVLSCMAAKLPGIFVGTAPHADYVLIRTENAHSETRLEEFSWLIGAELADSFGADIINSSLGYTSFDFPDKSFTYKDLDGKSSLITQAANKAVDKGMIVVNAAGNEGGNAWFFLGAPADAEKIITVGGVTKTWNKSSFSSNGPTADGRLKPDLVALATAATIVEKNGEIKEANGTSFATPILSGTIACLLQAAPMCSPDSIKNALQRSATFSNLPNNAVGYGIPNVEMALAMLGQHPQMNPKQDKLFETNASGNEFLYVRLYAAHKQTVVIQMCKINKKGKQKKVRETKIRCEAGSFLVSNWGLTTTYSLLSSSSKKKKGNYVLVVKTKELKTERKFKIN